VLWQHVFKLVVCVLSAVPRATTVARGTALSTHTTSLNTCCHNTVKLITMYFY